MGRKPIIGAVGWLAAVVIMVHISWSPLPALDPRQVIDRYLLDQWDTSSGIPSDTIVSIAQTPDGYLWIGTLKGLVRFDGITFTTGFPPDKGKNDPLGIRTLLVDKGGTLWVGSDAGLLAYHCQTGRFKTYTTADGLTSNLIRCLLEDMRGNLWVSFDASYVARFSEGRFTPFDASSGLGGKRVNTIIEDQKGLLWFGTREDGVFTFRDGKFSRYAIPGLHDLFINTMHQDRNGDLWIGTTKGLFLKTDRGTRRYTTADGLSDDAIYDIVEDSGGTLWFGTGKSVNRLKKNPDGTVGFECLKQPFLIICLFEDREKNLWMGTYTKGLKRLKDRKFRPFPPLEAQSGEILSSLFEDQNGDIWVGTLGGKLFHCRGDNLVETVKFPELSGVDIAAIAEDGEGNLWLGTNGKGVFQRKNGVLTRLTTGEGLADNLVTSISRDSRGHLWFSTFDGVSVRRYPSGEIESLHSRDGLSGQKVHNVYEDKRQDIWIAAERGITVLKGGKIAGANLEYYLAGVSVTCIYEDPSPSASAGQVYWIATHGEGLKRLRLKDGEVTVTSYTTLQGLTTDYLYQFFEDRLGNFWLMSTGGILRVDKAELDRPAGGGVPPINCCSFGVSDGLKSPGFSHNFSRHSALETGSGEFWFLTDKGISILDPAKTRVDKVPPPVVIEAALFDRKPISLYRDGDAAVDDDPLSFKGIADFSFHFTAPTFLSPEKIKFKYKLEGVNEQWVFLPPGKDRAAHYRDLAPGTYTFTVTACNADGVWNRTGDSLTFTLAPRWFETTFFKIIIPIFLVVLLAAAFYIYRKHPLGKKAKYKSSPMNPRFAEECVTRLKYLMEFEKLYRDPDISLQALADKLSISPHLVSQLLNEKLNRNFSDFINFYRIEEAKGILRSPRGSKRKISAVARGVGFNTMVAFYNAFKKYTDQTPNRYKKETRGRG